MLTHSGTQGNPCENVQIVSCHFVDGSGDQLLMDDVDGVQIVGCVFENPTTKAINGTPSTSASYMRSIVVSGCNFSDANNSVYIIGGSGTASDNWRSIRIVDNEIISDAGNGITCGTTAAIVKYGYVIDNLIISVTGDGINALLSGGRIACNYCDAAGGDGLDLLASTAATAAVTVCDNTFTNATTAGIDVNTSTSCTICHNDVTGSATPIDVSGATTPILVSNIGHDDPPARNGVFYGTQITHTGTVARTKKWTFTIPANTIPAAGDGVRVMMAGEHSSNGNAIVEFEVGGMQTGDSTTFSVSEYNYEAVIVNTSAGNQRFSSVATGDGAASAANGTGTVDFTADQDVDIYLTLSDTGGTATIDHVQVEYFRLEAGGASA